jgi:hypothetical protein
VSRLTDLIAQAKAKDPQLGADLDREFKVLSSRLPFGLNFERHRPEAVELPQRPIRKGDKVRVLPARGSTKKGDQRLWQVKAIRKTGDTKVADLELLGTANMETKSLALDDLVVVAEFRDTIYPGLLSTGNVERGGDKPFHTVINGENYHVLDSSWSRGARVSLDVGSSRRIFCGLRREPDSRPGTGTLPDRRSGGRCSGMAYRTLRVQETSGAPRASCGVGETYDSKMSVFWGRNTGSVPHSLQHGGSFKMRMTLVLHNKCAKILIRNRARS